MIHIDAFINTIIADIARYGYLAIVFGMLIEGAGLPVPSEPMLLFAGYLVHVGALSLYGAVGSALAGSLAGALIMYWIGAAGGRPLILRYGRFIRLTPDNLARTESWFGRFGRRAVSLARIIPIIRTWVSLPAGIARMPIPEFLAFSALGVLPWNTALVLLGMGLGAGWESFESRLLPVDLVAVVLPLLGIAAVAVFLWVRARRRNGRAASNGATTNGKATPR